MTIPQYVLIFVALISPVSTYFLGRTQGMREHSQIWRTNELPPPKLDVLGWLAVYLPLVAILFVALS